MPAARGILEAAAPTRPGRRQHEVREARAPPRQFRPSRWRRLGNAIIGLFARAGLLPSTYLQTTRGRKTGRPLTHPVTVVEQEGRPWPVAPDGPVSWVPTPAPPGG
jgi:hypothetical protein